MASSPFTLTTLFVSFAVVTLFISPVVHADDDDDKFYTCGSSICLKCDSSNSFCVKCDSDYYLNVNTGNCEDRDSPRDRGDGMS